MQLDLSSVASNLPQLAQLVGAFAGGNGASTAGALAGLGDVQHEKNLRAYEGVKQFADQLEKIGMDTENWNEAARNQAMQERLNLLSPRTISQIYGNPNRAGKILDTAWTNVLHASSRPDTAQQADQNAAAGAVPQLRAQLPGISSANAAIGAANEGGARSGLAALGPAAGPSFDETANALSGAVSTANAPVQTRTGPLSPGEKALRMKESMAPLMSGFGGGGAVGGGMSGVNVVPTMTMGPHGPTIHTNIVRSFARPIMMDLGDGKGFVPGYWDNVTRSYQDTSGNAVRPVSFFLQDSPHLIQTVGPDGQPATTARTSSQLFPQGASGEAASFAKPVPTKTWRATGPNGEQYEYDVKPGFNGQPNTLVAKRTIGTVPFALFKGEMAALGVQGKQLSNAINEYKLNGSITLPDRTQYIPNGTLLDDSGNPIAPIAGPHAYPTGPMQLRATTGRDLTNAIDDYNAIAARLQSKYGPIEGRINDWAAEVAKGNPSWSDKDQEDVGRLIMQGKTIGALSTTAHRFMSGEFAKDVDKTIGLLGQNYYLQQGKLGSLRDFGDRIYKENIKTVLPQQKTQGGGVHPRKPGKPQASTQPGGPAAAPSVSTGNDANSKFDALYNAVFSGGAPAPVRPGGNR